MANMTVKRSRIMEILERETGGHSYKSHKYSLDETRRSPIEYGEVEKSIQWARRGETKDIRTYVPLIELSRQIGKDQLFRYFLDGSRHVYKVDEMGFEKSGNRTAVYPIVAGQIGVGCCRRDDKRMHCEKLEREIVITMPDIAQSSGKKQGFLTATAQKLNDEGTELARISASGWKFSTILSYSSAKEEKEYNDKGTAQIQMRMMANEQKMVADLVSEKKLNDSNYLIKDGSLEYKPSKNMRSNEHEYQKFKNNYDYVIGVSKQFNPEICLVLGDKPNPGFIAELPPHSRTPVAYFTDKDFLGDIGFAVWYIRIRDQSQTRTPFDGVLKVQKILVSKEEIANGMDSDLVDLLSAHLINERNPVCYGADLRWANHLYSVYLTEMYVKSHYLSKESFLHLF